MGKRGPPPKGEYENKSTTLSTRLRADTRARLVAAATASGRSVSQEVEFRLRRSFDDDEKVMEGYGSRRNRAFMKMIALSTEGVFNHENLDAEWLDDPKAYDLAVRRINMLLEAYRPGPASELDALEMLGVFDSQTRLISAIQNADATLPMDGSGGPHINNLLKADLGEVAGRPTLFFGTADEIYREAARRRVARADAAANTQRGTPKKGGSKP